MPGTARVTSRRHDGCEELEVAQCATKNSDAGKTPNWAGKYSRSGLQHMKATLSRMFSDAVAWGYLRENPVRNVKLPHARLTPPQPYLTAEQVRSLVFKLREPYRTITLTAVLTGLRPSELFGLRWSDLDFKRQTVQINRSYYMGEFGMPKTNRSRRTLLMPPVLSMALQQHCD